MRQLLLVLSTLMLSACMDLPAKYVPQSDAGTYWVPRAHRPLEMLSFHGPRNACVLVGYVIRKDGKAHNVKVLKSSIDDGPFADAAILQMRRYRFDPAPGNGGRRERIRTSRMFVWEWQGFGSLDDVRSDCVDDEAAEKRTADQVLKSVI